MNSEIRAFIEHARKKGMDHATIRMLLLSMGWKEKDVAKALTEESLDIPIPAPPDVGGAREAFLHLLTFTALYTGVFAVVSLLFAYINRLFPDPVFRAGYPISNGETEQMENIRWAIAALIVALPVFLWLSRLLLREMRASVEKSRGAVRRWLTYLTLFLATVALCSDGITLVYYLLQGELTIRFVLKVLVVLVIAGAVLTYYLLALRLPVQAAASARLHKTFAGISCGIAAVALVWGVVVAGSPLRARLQALDNTRFTDLRGIKDEIGNICLGDTRWAEPSERRLVAPLPRSLDEVRAHARSVRPDIRDPGTGEPYGYEVLDERRFRLCATFDGPRDERNAPSWNHPAGRHCFEFDVFER